MLVFVLGDGCRSWRSAAAILVAQGAGRDAFDDIFLYGRALATDTLPDPNAPRGLIRWITGNADPRGRLPWPFGTTDYLVWWGTASWPLWLASIPSLAYLLLSPGTTAPRRLLAGWAIAAWAQVTLPGLYWQHYYLLPIAGAAIAVAVCFDRRDRLSWLAHSAERKARRPRSAVGASSVRRRSCWRLVALCCWRPRSGRPSFSRCATTCWLPPEELTIRYKGGRQWVVLRTHGPRAQPPRDGSGTIRTCISGAGKARSISTARMDSPTRHFFVDNLLRDQADRDHPLIRPRTEEIMAALTHRPPELIFTGYPPFRALRAFLNDRYLPSRLAPGLWVRQDDYGRFESAGTKSKP